MPCDAVATVSARIPLDTKDILARPQAHVAALKQLVANVMGIGSRPEMVTVDVFAGSIYIYTGNYTIRIDAEGVYVNVPRFGYTSATSDSLKSMLTGYIGLLAQAKMKAALAQLGKITTEQRAPNGALVLSLEV